MRSKKSKIVTAVLFVVLVISIACAVYFYVRDLLPKDIIIETTESDTVSQNDEEATFSSGTSVDEYLLRKVNFDALTAINSDVVTWIYIPNTNIDSYVMQEPVLNEYKYNDRNIYLRYTSTGSFMIPKSPMDLEDAHMLILGHHMPYSSRAFGNLVDYYGKTFDYHPYIYMYYPDHSERWRVWTANDVKDDDMVYELPYEYNTEHYGELLTHLRNTARYVSPYEPDVNTKILCLSTCNRWSRSVLGRFIVTAVPDAYYYYDGNAEFGGHKYIKYSDMNSH